MRGGGKTLETLGSRLKEAADAMGASVQEIPGDGACQFAAVVAGLPGWSVGGLRARVVDAMLEDPTFEAHFAPSERYGSWEFYVEAMRGPYEYGDEMTLTAAATVTGTTIWVLDSRSPHILRRYAPRAGATGEQAVVTYVPEHYDRLLLPGSAMAELARRTGTVETAAVLQSIKESARQRLITAGDVEQNPGPGRAEMRFATLNVTNLLQYLPAADAVEADLLCCQEVTLLPCKRVQAEEYLRKWCCHWGLPPPGRLCRNSGSRSTMNAANGGLSTLVLRPIPAYDTMTALSHAAIRSPDRVSHTVVATGAGNTFVHVFNVYCPSGNGRAESEEREDMLEKILFAAADSLGDVPIMVMGDLNTEEDRSPVLRKALRNGWSDAAELHHARTGDTPPPPTFTSARTSGTRIDRILLNRITTGAFQCHHACRDTGS
ncbi:hypothetical protein DIPPA_26192 [Diplonema papillatum]|nr:hypothetical protein DIPPA_26192 [Diplonema papillatum]